MKRRDFLHALGSAAIATTASPRVNASTNNKKPNILLIVSDDQGYADIGCAGLANDVHTPNIDRLAKSGIRFKQAYASSPICNPSRAGLLTGCYQQRFGTFWYGGKGIHDARFKTIPELLKPQGYTNGYVGKVHYGGNVHVPGNRNFPLDHGFEHFYGICTPRKHYLLHNQAAEDEFLASKKKHKKTGQSLRKGPFWVGDKKKDQVGFSTDLIGKDACAFMERNKEKPFFLQVSFNAVHNFTHQLPQDYLDQHNLKGYRDWDPAKEDYYDWYKEGRKPNNPEGRAQYLGQLHYLDQEVGKLMNCLKRLKLEKNTLVIYISDNGGSTPIYANNTPFRGSKYTLYEGGIRVPMIASWPGRIQANQVLNNVVSAMDVLPTICQAVGATTPDYVDGQDLTPLLTGKDKSLHHQTLVWDTGHETAVRQGKWKLRTATNKRSADYEMVELQLGEFLYNLETDPGETTNLADKHPKVFAQLKEIHKTWRQNLKK